MSFFNYKLIIKSYKEKKRYAWTSMTAYRFFIFMGTSSSPTLYFRQ